MSTELAVAEPKTQALAVSISWTPDQIELIKNTICKGGTDDELKLFMYVAKRTGLDPLNRQIYAVKRYDNKLKREVMNIQTSIDGFRLVAERTGKYAGQLGPYWCGADGQWTDVWLKNEPPKAAKVGVIRSDFREPLWGLAKWDSFAQTYFDQKSQAHKTSPMWAKMPDHMLAKCAEALALRKAFPQELSGLYTKEEMDQAENEGTHSENKGPKPAALPVELDAKKLGAYKLQFTKNFNGRTLNSFKPEELMKLCQDIYTWATSDNKKPQGVVKEFLETAHKYLQALEREGSLSQPQEQPAPPAPKAAEAVQQLPAELPEEKSEEPKQDDPETRDADESWGADLPSTLNTHETQF